MFFLNYLFFTHISWIHFSAIPPLANKAFTSLNGTLINRYEDINKKRKTIAKQMDKANVVPITNIAYKNYLFFY